MSSPPRSPVASVRRRGRADESRCATSTAFPNNEDHFALSSKGSAQDKAVSDTQLLRGLADCEDISETTP